MGYKVVDVNCRRFPETQVRGGPGFSRPYTTKKGPAKMKDIPVNVGQVELKRP